MNTKSGQENSFGSFDVVKLILRIIFRYIMTAVAFAMLVWFIFPFFINIKDVGNIVGIIICVCYILWATNPFFISAAIYFIKQKKVGKIILKILFVLAIAFAAYAVAASVVMGIFANRTPPTAKNTTLVVLGCKVDGNSPSKSLRRRLEAAYDYLTANENIKCVVSGGQGSNEIMSEAQCMYDYLTEKGIDKDRLYIEDKSTNTKENIIYTREIIEQNNLETEITIVTDGYHQLRANITAVKNNVNVAGAVSANTPLEILPTYWVREWFAIPVELIRS